ncbi:ABC transporter permease [Microvirga arsenatis]|uniref:ABC transporter permease subunit n=1 Tax=Microvirga arsenatis TaxID=2692265 RepID=A0ABW9Z2E0_9HYPH|nr:iron ABC transporter permease [Microvirga arsenatis]NBJ12644.1 ABC transporter permease subunit [Microvirga arsenatis]NBJ26503.1 ABC transporter permease subunit [Microvirga arsenatis]
MSRATLGWIVLGWVGFALLPWYGFNGAASSVSDYFVSGSALVHGLRGAWWLLPILVPLGMALVPVLRAGEATKGRWLVAAGLSGLALIILQGFAIGLNGWTLDILRSAFGEPGPRQAGMGYGAALTSTAFLIVLCHGLAARGWCRGDAFVTSSIGVVIALITVFVFFPVTTILASAFADNNGNFAPAEFVAKFLDKSIWGLDCLSSNLRCGVAWNTLFLGLLVGVGTTALGLAFALIATRTGFRYKKLLRVMSVLPIITPPFVIGLALILLFGRSGALSAVLWDWFGIPRSRWIYGLPGVLIAQLLAFTPIAFLVLIGVVQGISPTLEEASQTLRAKSWTTFWTVTLPLMRPGLANAFLLGFVESLADFGNPLVLGGNYEVLSTKIFFAVVGAQQDQGRAAVLSIILLAFTLGAFWLQHAWLGKKVYTTVTGKGDSGIPLPLPRRVALASYLTAIPWAMFTVVIYVMIGVGAFVRSMGRDYTPTLEHFLTAFRIERSGSGLYFSGSAWDSFFATVKVAALSAPLTAAIGLLTAYLLTRQRFSGQRSFEFGTLLSFAIPGTVVGVSYILAFNVPPIEITGTGFILVMCFVFRNMPVGVRSGIATLSQIDKSLDEASLTLGARSATTMRRVVLPLLRPAIVASLVYSFVRAMTAVSAVIFLVTAEYNMATTYIVGRVEAGEFGLAIAYSTVLIVVMLLAIVAIQLAVGERRLGRRSASTAPSPVAVQAVP